MGGKERKGERQKLKLLYLSKILSEETDERHGLSISAIIEKLAAYGVNADRKTLYLDLQELRRFGMDITSAQPGRDCRYYLASRLFELQELQIIADAVQTSEFISSRKARKLVKKLEMLTSKNNGKKLYRQIAMPEHVSSIRESGYSNIQKLQDAIDRDVQIRFKYFRWNTEKKPVLLRNGDWYQISPWSLQLEDGKFRMLAYDSEDGKIQCYHADHMIRITLTDRRREGEKQFKAFAAGKCVCDDFGMNQEEQTVITLEARNALADNFIDRFGKDIVMRPEGNDFFRVTVQASIGRELFAWIVMLGENARIVAPDEAVAKMREMISGIVAQYGGK